MCFGKGSGKVVIIWKESAISLARGKETVSKVGTNQAAAKRFQVWVIQTGKIKSQHERSFYFFFNSNRHGFRWRVFRTMKTCLSG